jgi:hypothetical protein
LWDFWDGAVETFSKAWRHGQRAVWKLPYDTHRRFMPLLCDCIPIVDEICRRFLSFVHKCVIGDSELVRFVVKNGVQFGGMFSLCGRNALFCMSRYSVSLNDIMSLDFNPNIVRRQCLESTSLDDINVTMFVMELAFIRDGMFSLPGLTTDNINDILSSVCSM